MGTLVIMSEIMKLDETIDKIMTKTESGIVSELDKILGKPDGRWQKTS